MAITDRVQHVRGSQSQVDAKQLQDGQIGVVEDKGNERLIFGTISGTNIKVPNQADLDTIQQDINSAIDIVNVASENINQALIVANTANNTADTANALATSANTQSIAVQNQVANIIANNGNGTTPTEVIDDRTDVNGVVHTTIKQRSDSDYNDLSGKIGNLSNAGLTETNLATAIKNDRVDISANATNITNNSNNIGNLSGLNTTTKTDLVSALNETISNKVDISQVVTTPTPNKILQMDNNGDLPTDITGNAVTVGGKTVGNASGNVPVSNGTVNTNLNADMLDGFQSSAFAQISSFVNNLNQNGYIKIPCAPNPLIIQWGATTVAGNNSATSVNFPISFTNNVLHAFVTGDTANATAVSVANVSGKTNFNILQNSSSPITVHWIAIGV